MKTLGEAAIDLPWLAPNVASMTTLARAQLPWVRRQLRTDPGFVLLSAHFLESSSSLNVALLEAVLHHQPHFHLGFVDWSQPGPDAVQRACFRQATLASQLAQKVGCDSQQGWIAGFLVPLGWLAVAAAGSWNNGNDFENLHLNTDVSAWIRQAWGHCH